MAKPQTIKPQPVPRSAFIMVALTALVAERKRLERRIETGWDSTLSLDLDRLAEAIRLLNELGEQQQGARNHAD